ncbi:MAG: peptidoglycan DD-metalloendopeptidase family protein [Flavobacteriales bacterium]|nr:peptidoglycan DD-metalloendopeptidase family protein [Flavobacteriales bacterium]
MDRLSRYLALAVACILVWTGNVRAQSDTLSIGGLEVSSPYGEGYSENYAGVRDIWNADDSARVIPCYTLYSGFDTESIFDRTYNAKKDSTRLQLATNACDSHFPICGAINSPFGRRHGRMHYGLDIELDTGDPVVCAFEGMVRISRFHKQFGNVIVVRHANGLETLYGHLSELLVEPGDHVEAGDLIGLGGSTGRSTGAHLHFETRYLGQPIDPQLFFNVKEGELRASTLLVHPGLFTVIHSGNANSKGGGSYKVRRGDTLSSIARRQRTTVRALCSANRIGVRSKLRVGQRLRLK